LVYGDVERKIGDGGLSRLHRHALRLRQSKARRGNRDDIQTGGKLREEIRAVGSALDRRWGLTISLSLPCEK
jgi:hypothetical protein